MLLDEVASQTEEFHTQGHTYPFPSSKLSIEFSVLDNARNFLLFLANLINFRKNYIHSFSSKDRLLIEWTLKYREHVSFCS